MCPFVCYGGHAHCTHVVPGLGGRWLFLEQTTKGYRPGNWQLHGIWALLNIGFCLPEVPESKGFLSVGQR